MRYVQFIYPLRHIIISHLRLVLFSVEYKKKEFRSEVISVFGWEGVDRREGLFAVATSEFLPEELLFIAGTNSNCFNMSTNTEKEMGHRIRYSTSVSFIFTFIEFVL